MKSDPHIQIISSMDSSLEGCSVEVIRTEQEFDHLQTEWDALTLSGNVSIYQTFSWVRAWWRHYGKDEKLHCVLFRSAGELIGIAPLFIKHDSILSVQVVRRVRFIGTGLSDYLDIIVHPGCEPIVCNELARYLSDIRSEWDIIDIEDANENSTFFKWMPRAFQAHQLRLYSYQGNVCPFVQLPSSWDHLVSNIGPNTRYNIRRKSKKLDTQYAFEVEAYRCAEDNLIRGMEEFFQVHGARWNSLGFPSAFDEANNRTFHHEIAQEFAKRGWLTLLFLKVKGLRVAAFVGFSFKNRLYMYQCNAHGPKDIMKQSPGLLLRSIAIKRGIAEGMKVFDFLRGDEMYKYLEWKAVTSRNWMLRATPNTLESRSRFHIFLVHEFCTKAIQRVNRELYSFKRFRSTKQPGTMETVKYLGSRSLEALHLGRGYFQRHYSRRTHADKLRYKSYSE